MAAPVGTPAQSANASNASRSWSQVFPAVTDGGIVVIIQGGDGNPVGTVVEAVIGGNTLPGTLVAHQNGGTGPFTHSIEQWVIPIGTRAGATATINVTLSASVEWGGCSQPLEDLDQTTPVRDSTGDGGALAVSDTTSSVVVDSEVGDYVIDAIANNGTNVMAPDGSQSSIRSAQVSDSQSASGKAGGATSTTMSWSNLLDNNNWAHLAVSYQSPSGGGGGLPPRLVGSGNLIGPGPLVGSGPLFG